MAAALVGLVLAACGQTSSISTPKSSMPPSPTSQSALASATPGTPGPRRHASLAYYPIGGYVLLFGGIAGTGGSDSTEEVYSDTWAWTDKGWLELHPPASPQGRSGASLGYDPVSKRMVLYGGGTDFYAQAVDPARNDTWAWDGSTWAQLHSDHQPTAGKCCAPTEMVTDPMKPALWLTSGLLQMWMWTGSDWVTSPGAARPPERFDFGFAYDQQLGGVVAACGAGGEGVTGFGEMVPLHDDTWLWKMGAWSELHPATRPVRGACAAAYDEARHELVVFSGQAGTFTFGGVSWSARQTTRRPPIEFSSTSSFAYDSAARLAVLFGGNDVAQPHQDLNQTWTWDGNDWSEHA